MDLSVFPLGRDTTKVNSDKESTWNFVRLFIRYSPLLFILFGEINQYVTLSCGVSKAGPLKAKFRDEEIEQRTEGESAGGG